MYEVIVAPKAKKQLKNITRTSKQVVLASVIEDLQNNPYLGKKLQRELSDRYVYRIGVHRIIYKIYKKEKVVEVISAGHRASVYN